MGPRKRAKPNPKSEPQTPGALQPNNNSVEGKDQSSTTGGASTSQNRKPSGDTRGGPKLEEPNLQQPSNPWYGGTWPRGNNKSTPVTQVARESITAAVGATSDAVATARAHTPPLTTGSLRKSLARQSSQGSNRLLPAAARISTTASSDVQPGTNAILTATHEGKNKKPVGKNKKPVGKTIDEANNDASAKSNGNAQENAQAATSKQETERDATLSNIRESGSWLSWFSRSEQADAQASNDENGKSKELAATADTKTNVCGTSSQESPIKSSPVSDQQGPNVTVTQPKESALDQRRSWLNLWGNPTPPPRRGSVSTTKGSMENAEGTLENPATSSETPETEVKAAQSGPQQTSSESKEHRRSSGWAFWSRDEPKQRPGTSTGEVALAGSPSQSKPEKDIVDDTKGIPAKVGKTQAASSPEKPHESRKPLEPQAYSKKPATPEVPDSKGTDSPKAKKKAKATETEAKEGPPNLVLPSFKSTHGSMTKSGLVQQLSRWFPLAFGLSSAKHLEPTSSPPKVKKALVIGVHGFFPTPLVRSFLGQPTGTSIRFANSAANALQRWTQAQGYSCEIDKVALEGEGKIAERINVLWKLLLNWVDQIRKADCVFVACHSQGCPVALMLVAKLIAFGCLPSARIGVCAMAGVNQGPFIDYKTRWIGATALELFEFARQDSKVSKDYEAALETVLKYGVKVLYVGSIDDQLVSLESSTFGSINHPNIYRAVFVDGRVHAPDFLTHLVGFALKLRNLGISDHGLIRELSTPLAGSLYSGEGHSRIYEDESVYYLAIEHALETMPLNGIQMHVQADGGSLSQNPYILPFAMRGLLEEKYVRTELYGEITDLIKQFDDWKPSSKVLKDVKFRLEGVRSKL